MKRFATANWQGTGMEGKGVVSTQSGVLNKNQYSFSSRFEEGIGTNPEELIAAAHAGCFSMKLSFNLSGAGLIPENIDTKATLTFENGVITLIHLTTKVNVAGVTAEKFKELADDAKANCPISQLMKCEITMDATME